MGKRWWLWGAFIAVHVFVSWLVQVAAGWPQGDLVLVYRPWVEQAFAGWIVGIDTGWVYPIAAIVPMLLASVFGSDAYVGGWLVLVTLLDAIGFQLLIANGRSRRRTAAGWWWLVFILALGPVGFARIDAITVPIAVVALLLVLRHPRTGAALLTIATWMKVWPAALIAALVVVWRRRVAVVVTCAVVSLTIVLVALIFGSGMNVFSFVTQQTGRGLQIEAPISTVYMWLAALGHDGAFVYYDRDILTFQVTGPNVDPVITAMTPLLVVAVVAVALFGLVQVRRGAAFVRLFPPLALAMVSALILFNKVGSPQFATWLVAPVVIGLALGGMRRFGRAAILALVIAGLTQLIYPYLYDGLLAVHPAMVVVLTVRNLCWVAMFALALVEMHRSVDRGGIGASAPRPEGAGARGGVAYWRASRPHARSSAERRTEE